ncbi:M28 family peptidase [Streptomyces sp. NPDC005811]|uniref:M28 family peptidase n=1 Tax=Streptomyces sp. NPDC005811 TaxID=3154565 RepID=UPI0033C8A08C
MGDSLVAQLLGLLRIDDVMDQVVRVSAFDRYQGSRGLEEAARTVAEAAVAAGLHDVGVRHFTADGRRQWWTFRAPVSWTPLTARLTVFAGPGPHAPEVLRVDHAEQPFTVATYSAATPAGGVVARLVPVAGGDPVGPEMAGAVALVDRHAFVRGSLLQELTAAGALGLVTDAPAKGTGPFAQVGRIELPPDSVLFGFSVTPAMFHAARAAVGRGATARAEVTVDRTAGMPVVSGVLPGDETVGEIWLTAHLCHPRPGSNDNASGVAALLGVAATLSHARRAHARYRTRRPIRFFWGAEFLGNAAVLHQRSQPGGGGLPHALINLDMVGEDQALCRSPFVVERPPETTPTLLGPLAEHVVEQVFAATADHPGTWGPSPFLGFSDHALYADPSVDRPAVQFCHPADRFNHSAGDSPDKVSEVEMARSTVAGAALAHVLASDGPDPATRSAVVERWCRREDGAVAALRRGADAPAGWVSGLADHVTRQGAALRALAAGASVAEARNLCEAGRAPSPDGRRVHRRWDGPLNLRAMLGELPPPTRTLLASMIAEDKHHLSVLFNLAIRAGGRHDRARLVADTSYALRRPLDPHTTTRLFDALLESGWLAEE